MRILFSVALAFFCGTSFAQEQLTFYPSVAKPQFVFAFGSNCVSEWVAQNVGNDLHVFRVDSEGVCPFPRHEDFFRLSDVCIGGCREGFRQVVVRRVSRSVCPDPRSAPQCLEAATPVEAVITSPPLLRGPGYRQVFRRLADFGLPGGFVVESVEIEAVEGGAWVTFVSDAPSLSGNLGDRTIASRKVAARGDVILELESPGRSVLVRSSASDIVIFRADGRRDLYSEFTPAGGHVTSPGVNNSLIVGTTDTLREPGRYIGFLEGLGFGELQVTQCDPLVEESSTRRCTLLFSGRVSGEVSCPEGIKRLCNIVVGVYRISLPRAYFGYSAWFAPKEEGGVAEAVLVRIR